MASNPITLVCPSCARRQTERRDRCDPSGTVEVRIVCPDCDDGDFNEATYFDADGHQLSPLTPSPA